MMDTCVRCIVSGRVQGVFFRDSTRRKANELGIRGWVRNRRDGAVEVLACGDAASVDTLQRWLATGPPDAAVTGITCIETTCDQALSGFVIRPTE